MDNENRGNPIDFKEKRRQKIKEKKLQEKAKRKEEKSKEFRASIKSDFDPKKYWEYINQLIYGENEEKKKKSIKKKKKELDQYEVYKSAKASGILQKPVGEIHFGETTLQKVEKKFDRQNTIIHILGFLLIIAFFFGLSYFGAYVTLSEETKEQSVVSERVEDFKEKLKQFDYDEKDKLIEFLEINNIQYTMEERNDMQFIEFFKDDIGYFIRIDNYERDIIIWNNDKKQ